jgi:hypothetical protein
MFNKSKHYLTFIMLLVFIGISASTSVKAADPLSTPSGDVILTFDGQIARTNTPDGKAQWDLDMLKALGTVTFSTKTPWLEGMTRFEGVLVRDVLKATGSSSSHVLAYALDGYSNEIPVKDFDDYEVILAFAMNGEVLAEDKGPLWIMYPFDAHPGIDIDEISAHAVWQLARITVK